MHGMFRTNGGCGYVKKPNFLMQKGPRNEVFDPKKPVLVKKTLKVSLDWFWLRSEFDLCDDKANSQGIFVNVTGESLYGGWMALGF